MTTPPLTRARPLYSVFSIIALLTFLLPVIAYIGLALQRLTSPVLLEWMEGGSLQMMQRILSGKPLYGPPSIEFVPYTYTPLYFYVSALVSELVGDDLFPLRLVSFVASLSAFVFLFLLVRRESRSSLGGAAAVGLFAGSYAINGNWFDIARIDSLCFALLLAGMWLALGRGRALELITGGVLVALAFFTKQVALVVLGPLIVAIMIRHQRTGLYFAVPALSSIVFGCLILDAIHGGWFLFYVLESPRTRWQSNFSLAHLARAALIEFIPVFLVSIAISFPATWQMARRPSRAGTSFLMAVGGLFLASAWGRVESINFLNSSIPAHLGLALLFGFSVGTYTRGSQRSRTPLLITMAFALQLWVFTILLQSLVPTKRDLENQSRYTAFLGSLSSPVFVPDQGYASQLGPDNSFAHTIGMMDLMMGGDDATVERFQREMEEALNARRFETIVVDTPLSLKWFREPFERNYRRVFIEKYSDIWTPIVGFEHTPEIYKPRNDLQ